MDWDQIAFEHLCRTQPEVAIEIDRDAFLLWSFQREMAVLAKIRDEVTKCMEEMEFSDEQRPAN